MVIQHSPLVNRVLVNPDSAITILQLMVMLAVAISISCPHVCPSQDNIPLIGPGGTVVRTIRDGYVFPEGIHQKDTFSMIIAPIDNLNTQFLPLPTGSTGSLPHGCDVVTDMVA